MSLLLAAPFHNSPQSAVKASMIKIFAEMGWQNSGVNLKAGQYYMVKAYGSWSSGYNNLAMGPEGRGYGTIINDALVGWIALKKPERLGYESYKKEIVENIILIGRGGMFKAKYDGILWLAMGEWSGCKECAGELEVIITVYD